MTHVARAAGAVRPPPAAASSPYGARHFGMPPDRGTARRLLRQLAESGCRAAPRVADKPLVLYGGGDLGRLARDHLRTVGLDFGMVVDRDAARLRSDPLWTGSRVLAPSEVPQAVKRSSLLLVCVSTAPFAPLRTGLAADGWADIVPFYDFAESQRHLHPLSNGWFAGGLTPDDLARSEAVLDGWDDDPSRAHHLQFLAWRLAREEWTFAGAPVTRDDRFFIPEVVARLEGVRIFVDAGAHHGAVTQRFAALTGNRFGSIVAVEPDAENAAALERTLARLPSAVAGRIELLPHVLDAELRRRLFHDGLGYASQLSGTGSRTVETRTLDGLGLAPDFVKLHLEGAELDALRGGIGTIARHRPLLAVTTYHNADGIWRLPSWLMDGLEGYRFLMRLHGWCGTGAVVYAIPAERAAKP